MLIDARNRTEYLLRLVIKDSPKVHKERPATLVQGSTFSTPAKVFRFLYDLYAPRPPNWPIFLWISPARL